MEQKTSYKLPIAIMFALFFMIAFVTGLPSPMGVIVAKQFGASAFESQLGFFANFIAYAFMGIPAGLMLKRIGYKKTAMTAVTVGFVGVGVQFLSGVAGSFAVYLAGAFICGFSVCMLNTVVNPMLNTLGGGGVRGNQLLQFGSTFNSLAGTLTPLFVGALIGTVTARTTMTDVTSLLFLAMGVFAVAALIITFVPIPEPHLRKGEARHEKSAYSPWNFRHTVLGVVGIFVYVGVEIGIPGTLNFYLADESARGAGLVGNGAAIGGAIAAVYWLLMLVGRSLSSLISGKVSSRVQLTAVSTAAILLVVLAIVIPKTATVAMPGYSVSDGFQLAQVPVSALLLVLCGLCTSVMWGGIFNLAVEGLGKYTAQASGIFMMMVVGGGVLPLFQQFVADKAGYMTSYWVIIAGLAYLLYYALIGCKNVNTDIPVEE